MPDIYCPFSIALASCWLSSEVGITVVGAAGPSANKASGVKVAFGVQNTAHVWSHRVIWHYIFSFILHIVKAIIFTL
jgi:hypothetical protein